MPQKFIMNTLKFFREEAGISQSQLAIRSGVSLSLIKKLESGKRSLNKTSLEIIYKFAVILQIPMEYFVDTTQVQLKSSYKEYFGDVMDRIFLCYRIPSYPYDENRDS